MDGSESILGRFRPFGASMVCSGPIAVHVRPVAVRQLPRCAPITVQVRPVAVRIGAHADHWRAVADRVNGEECSGIGGRIAPRRIGSE